MILRQFRNLLIFISLIVLFDFMIGSMMNYLYFYPGLKSQNELSYAIESSDEQILIFGASTADNHFNSDIIRKRTGFSCYNAGYGGQSILFIEALNRCILKRHKPRLIVLNLDWSLYDSESFDKLGVLLPYYSNHPEIRDIIEKRSRFEKVKLLSRIYPFNSSMYTIGQQFFGTPRDTIKNGFNPISRSFKINYDGLKKDLSVIPQIHPAKLEAYNGFIKQCKENRVNLIFTISPVYDSTFVNTGLFLFADSLAKSNNIRLINFAVNDAFYNKDLLFLDHGHLNNQGANLFSEMIADSLSKYLDSNSKLVTDN
jgi:hypothetical protein